MLNGEHMFTFVYKVFRSFTYAIAGIVSAVHERNMKVHLLASIVVLSAGVFFQISKFEWMIVLMLTAMVISAEMVNTAIEELANIVRDELKLDYKATQRARDVAAGAVLVLAYTAAFIAILIFVPKIVAMLI